MRKPDNHKAEFMVPRFLGKPTAQATIAAVKQALPHEPQTVQLALAAYVWYQRSNHRKDMFSGWTIETKQECARYYHTHGVFPVCADRLAGVKPATVAKYAKLLAVVC
jgi:hypothetical protein